MSAQTWFQGSKQQVLVAGGVAGLFSRFCIAPLDVLKIRLQLQIHALPDPSSSRTNVSQVQRGTIRTFKSILRDEGVTAFWKGNIPAELLYVAYGSAQFFAYRFMNQSLQSFSLPSVVTSFVSGAVAGAAATTVTYPLDLLRTRFAAQGPDKIYASLRSSLRDIARDEGLVGFFRGLGAGVGQIVPYMGLFFSTYETLRPSLMDLALPFGSGEATAGVLAGVFAKTGVFPLDLIRKRLQVQGPTRGRFAGGMIPIYGKSVWGTGKAIVIAEGWRGLYRGLGVGLVKSAPASAITMWTYERTLKVLKSKTGSSPSP